MLTVILACVLLISTTTMIHYEALRELSRHLPTLRIASRSKLLVVIFSAFVAHALEIAVYGIVLFVLVKDFGVGKLVGPLGFGDLVPTGAVRLLAGTETLNGLLLIGWSTSFAYLAMERFWREDE